MYDVIKKEEGLIIASNGQDFFRCFQYDSGEFHRKAAGGLSVESRDLDYISIGATKYQTLESALAG